MHRILPGLGIGGRYLADFSDTVAPFLGLAQALATAAWTFLPPARISTTDFGPARHLLAKIDDLAVAHFDADGRLAAAHDGAKTH